MGKMKEMLLSIVEAYDYNGLTIKQISDTYGMPEDEVIAILSEHSMTFAQVKSVVGQLEGVLQSRSTIAQESFDVLSLGQKQKPDREPQ